MCIRDSIFTPLAFRTPSLKGYRGCFRVAGVCSVLLAARPWGLARFGSRAASSRRQRRSSGEAVVDGQGPLPFVHRAATGAPDRMAEEYPLGNVGGPTIDAQ
eukprot:11177897-Alexandrium_andersonii.AAC.1